MPYTALSLTSAWLLALVVAGLAASGIVTGVGLAILVSLALVMPAAILRLTPTPAIVGAPPKTRALAAVLTPGDAADGQDAAG